MRPHIQVVGKPVYNYAFDYEYDSQQISFDIKFASNFTSVFVPDGINYRSVPIVINGAWNPELFFDVSASSDVNAELNGGKIPMSDFSNYDDPLNILKSVMYISTLETEAVVTNTLDRVFNLFEVQAKNIDPQNVPFITIKYSEILKNDLRVSFNYNIYDATTDKNISIVDFMDELLFASQIDMVRSANPLSNTIGSKLLMNRMITEKIKSIDKTGPVIQIPYIKRFFDSDLSDNYFSNPMISNPAFDEFYPELDPMGNYITTISSIDFINPYDLGMFNFQKTAQLNPYSEAPQYEQFIHNLYGGFYLDFVYESQALLNAERLTDDFRNYYDDLGLVPKYKSGIARVLGSLMDTMIRIKQIDRPSEISALWNYPRANLDEIPMIYNFYLKMIVGPNIYYGARSLIPLVYKQLMGST